MGQVARILSQTCNDLGEPVMCFNQTRPMPSKRLRLISYLVAIVATVLALVVVVQKPVNQSLFDILFPDNESLANKAAAVLVEAMGRNGFFERSNSFHWDAVKSEVQARQPPIILKLVGSWEFKSDGPLEFVVNTNARSGVMVVGFRADELRTVAIQEDGRIVRLDDAKMLLIRH